MNQTNSWKKLKKRGASVVISTFILIVLSLVVISIIWILLSDFVKKEVSESEACFGIFEKVNLDREKTCYNSPSRELHFFIRIGEVELDGIFVSISSESSSESFIINKEEQNIPHLLMYDGSNIIILPEKNEGFEYVFNMADAGFSEDELPEIIQILPIIKKVRCESSEFLNSIENCPFEREVGGEDENENLGG